jgi:hypothetical protein
MFEYYTEYTQELTSIYVYNCEWQYAWEGSGVFVYEHVQG